MNDVQELLKSLDATENRLLAELVKSVGKSIESASEEEAANHAAAFLLFVRKFMPEALEEADLDMPDSSLEKDDESGWQTHLKNVMADNGYYWFGNLEKHYYGEIGSGAQGKDIRGYGPVGAPGPKKVPHSNKRSQKAHGRGSGKRTLIEYAMAYKDLHPNADIPKRKDMIDMSHEALIELADKYGFLPETRGGTLNVVDTKEDGADAKLKNRARDIADHASAPERGAGKNFTRKKAIAAVLDTIKENKKLEAEHTKGSIKDKARRLGVEHKGKGPAGSDRTHENADHHPGKKGYGSHDPENTLDEQPSMDSVKGKLQRKAQAAKLKAKRALSPKKKIEDLENAPTTAPDPKTAPTKVKEQDLAVSAGPTATEPKAKKPSMLDTLLTNNPPEPKPVSAPASNAGGGSNVGTEASGDLIPDYSNKKLTVTGSAGGTTGAQVATDEQGNKWIIKAYANDANSVDRVATELVSNAIYAKLGHKVPKMGTYNVNGKTALAYPMLPGQSQSINSPSKELGDGYVADAYLANWDFIGASDDNILWDGGKPFRVDQGGTMGFRAQGKKKAFGSKPEELESLILAGQAKGKVDITIEGLKQQAAKLDATLTDDYLNDLTGSVKWSSTEMEHDVNQSLQDRAQWLGEFAKGEHELTAAFKTFVPQGEAAPAESAAEAPAPKGKATSEMKAARAARTAAGKLITGLRNSDDITSQNVGTTLLKLLNNPETFNPGQMKASGNTERQAAQEALKKFHAAWEAAGKPKFAPYGPLTAEQKKQKKAEADIKAKVDAGNAPKHADSKFVATLKDKTDAEKLTALDDLARQHHEATGKAKVKLYNQMKALQEHLLATTDAQKSDLERRVKNVKAKLRLDAKNAPKKQAEAARRKAFEKLSEKALRTKLQKANNDLIDLLWKAVDEDSQPGGTGVSDETLLAHATVDADIKTLRAVLKDKHGYDAKSLSAFRQQAVAGNKRSKESGLPYTKGDWSAAIHDHEEAHAYLKGLEKKDPAHPGHKYIKAGTGSWDGIIKSAARNINAARKKAGKALLGTRDLLKPSAANEPEVKPYLSSLKQWADLVDYIDDQGRLTKDMVITRGTYTHDVLGWDIDEVNPGQDIIDLMPFNGSPYKDGAPPFRKSPVMVEALVRKGMRIIDVNNMLGNHSYNHEHEVLVEPGHVARVVSKERNEGKNSAWGAKAWHVRVEFHDGNVTHREGATAIQRNKKRQKDLEAAKLKAQAQAAADKLKQKQQKAKLKDISDQLNGVKKSGTLTPKELLAKMQQRKQP